MPPHAGINGQPGLVAQRKNATNSFTGVNQVRHYELTDLGRKRIDAQHDTVVEYLKQQFPDWSEFIGYL